MDESVSVLRDLVAIRSTNPMGRDFTGPGYTEAGVAEYVDSFLRGIGADSEVEEVLPGRPNVIGQIGSSPDAPTLVFEAHMDTVLDENMSIDPFDPVIKEGKLYGRGSCDTKASLAGMLVALKRLVSSPGRPRLNLMLAATMDEEFQFHGINRAVENGFEADWGICGEPTMLDLIVAHKGAVRWKIHSSGVSTHSSKCDDGVNAIYRMAKVVNALEGYHAGELRPRPQHPLVGGPTLSVGRIMGGQTVNTVPDWAHIEIDRRVLPGETPEEARSQVIQFLQDHPEIRFDLRHEEPFHMSPSMEISEEEPIVKAAISASSALQGKADIRGVPFGTDAGEMVKAGIPTLVMGPGNILQAHSAEEFVEVEQVEMAARIYEECARRLVSA